jgi:C4-dicarboxylate-specific signal transduction histidine kinase
VKQTVVRASHDGKDWEIEHRLLMPNGTIKYVHVVAHAINGKPGGHEFIGAVMDITATRCAEDSLRRAEADLAHVSRVTTLGEFAASIAHEVNQPLTAVINNANACLGLLPDSDPNLEEVRSALGEIIEDADRATGVIAGIRRFAKKSQPDRVLLDLKDVVADVQALARYESRSRRAVLRFELSEKLPPVLGDRIQLQQVLLNLVVNGMDAMNAIEESRRTLTLGGHSEIRDGKRMAVLAVHDAGIGIKPDKMDKLFEAFYTTKPQGMGMGLAISRSIVEAHGGRLWAEPNPGGGAIFQFSLPAAEHVIL